MRVSVDKIGLLFNRGLPCLYVGKFQAMGALFGMDLTGPVIHRDGRPLPIRASIGRLQIDDPEQAAALLFQAALAGREIPSGGYAWSWWESPVLCLDMILPGDYYNLYFMRDHGTGRGPCVACYATMRSTIRLMRAYSNEGHGKSGKNA